MKKIGYFNENMLVYKNIKPLNPLSENKDKIINSNSKNEVALLFEEPGNIDKIISVLKSNNVSGNFLISKEYYLNNFESLEESKSDIVIKNELSFLKKELKNNKYYCYSKTISNCKDSYLIEETSFVNNYRDLKKVLTKGTIIIVSDTSYLDIYIKYILSKGINIVSITDFISENIWL